MKQGYVTLKTTLNSPIRIQGIIKEKNKNKRTNQNRDKSQNSDDTS